MLPPPCSPAGITAEIALSSCLVLYQWFSALAAAHFTWHLFLFHTFRPHSGLFWHPYINSGQDQCQVNLFWIFIWKCYIIYSQKSSLFFHTAACLSMILKHSVSPCVVQSRIAILCTGMSRLLLCSREQVNKFHVKTPKLLSKMWFLNNFGVYSFRSEFLILCVRLSSEIHSELFPQNICINASILFDKTSPEFIQ